MRYSRSLLFGLLLLPGLLLAQQMDQPAQSETETFLTSQTEDQLLTNEMVGSAVTNQDGERIGTIRELIVSEDGEVMGAVVGVGGFLGIGDKDVAVTWDEMEITRDPDTAEFTARVEMDRQELEDAPEFARREQSGM
ncbi:MAG: PRC-barrel domain-containing protein [Aquisalimonadaceae bacterium]